MRQVTFLLACLITVAAFAGVKPLPSLPKTESDATTLAGRVDSLTQLITVETDANNATSLRLARGTSLFQLSKLKNDKGLFKQASDDFDYVQGHMPKSAKAEQKAYLDYLQGLVRAEQGRSDEARKLFRQSLETDPKSSYAAGLSSYLADDAYGTGRTDEADSLYTKLSQNGSGSDRAKALYRLAVLQLQKQKSAEAYKAYTGVLALKDAGEYRGKSINDIASIVAKEQTPDRMIAQVSSKLNAAEKKQFLSAVIEKQIKLTGSANEKLMERAVGSETDAVERVRLRLSAYQSAREQKRSDPGAKFEALKQVWSKLSEADVSLVQEKIGGAISTQVEAEIADLSKDYAVEQKAKPHASALGQQLKARLAFALSNLKSDKRADLYGLSLDVGSNESDWSGVVRVSDEIAADDSLKSIQAKALRDRIQAEQKTNAKAEEIESLERYITDANALEWAKYATRLGVLLVDENKFAEAIPVWQKVDAAQKTEESYFRLQYARFKASKYSELIADERKKFETPRVKDILRESHLKLAQGSKSGGTFAEYEINIKEVLRLNQDQAKRALILKDYFARLQKEGLSQKLTAQVAALSPSERYSPALVSYTQSAVTAAFAIGDAKAALALTAPGTGRPADFALTHALAELANGTQPTKAWLRSIPKEKQAYVAGLVALAEPASYDVSFKADAGLNLDFLAYKLRSCEPPLKPTAQQSKKFGSLLAGESTVEKTSTAENQLKQIKFSKIAKLTPPETKKMMAALDRVRKARAMVMTEVPKLNPRSRLRVLKQAQATENGAANMVLTAPMPPGLAQSQAAQYKSGIAELASEFSNQGKEFGKAVESISRQTASVETPSAVVKLKDPSKWPWPKAVNQLRQSKPRLITALIALDLGRANEDLKETDYYSARAGFLLTRNPCSYMAEYVRDELTTAKQTKLLETWGHQ